MCFGTIYKIQILFNGKIIFFRICVTLELPFLVELEGHEKYFFELDLSKHTK